jgi:hypothetical protein
MGIITIEILTFLGKMDLIFLNPILITGEKEEIDLDLGTLDLENSSHKLAHEILRSEWYEITHYEGNENATINYSRKEGYSMLFRFGTKDRTFFWVSCRIGSNIFQTFTIRGFSKEVLFDYSWYDRIFKNLVEKVDATMGVVAVSNESFGKFYNELHIKYPIGWITFFSNEFKPHIPDDLSEVRYEYVSGGKYLYTSDEDFLKDKDSYFAYREKLRRIITEIKQRVPEFSTESLS